MTAADSSPYAVLSRITGRQLPAVATERCEMCSEQLADAHQHVVNIQGRQLMCVCRGCYLLFTDSGAELRYRAVPERYLAFPGFGADTALWTALEIPVKLAFFFRNSAMDRLVAFYPGPGGATESATDLEAWADIAGADPRVELIDDDTEALLARSTEAGTQCFLVPIDRCYELVGGMRRRWRGFDGGSEVATFVDAFFERIAGRADDVPR
ncbi:MAG: DUF5947 family protein [Mycobacterium sp.]